MKISVFTSKKPTGKKLSLNNGELVKGKLAPFADGTFETVDVPITETGLKSLLAIKRDPFKALAMGTHKKEPSGTITTKAQEVPGDSFARSNENFTFAAGLGFIAIDIDAYSKEQAPECLMYDNMPSALAAITRALGVTEEDLFGLFAGSTSTGIYADGKLLSEDNGWHGLIAVKDASKIPEALERLHIRECIAGRGFIRLCTNGVLLTRSIFDRALKTPCQLVYCGADVGEGLSQDVQHQFLTQGAPLDLEALVPPLTMAEKEEWTQTKWRLSTTFEKTHEDLIAKTVKASDERNAKAEGVDVSVITARRERMAGSWFELLPEDNIINAAGQVFSVMDVFERPDDFIGKYFKDPFEPDYGDQKMVIRKDTRGGCGYVAIIFSHNRGIATLRPTLYHVFDRVTKGMQTEGKVTLVDRAKNADMLDPDWATVAGMLHRTKHEAMAQLLKSVLAGGIELFRRSMRKAAGPAGALDRDPNIVVITADNRLGIEVQPENNNSATDETFEYLASKSRFYRTLGNTVTLVVKKLSDKDTVADSDALLAPVRGLPLDMLSLDLGVMRATIQRYIQYYEMKEMGFGPLRVDIDIPRTLEGDLIHSIGKRMPLLLGLSTSPLLTKEGFVVADGYNAETATYLMVSDELKATVPDDDECTLEAAQAAYRWLVDVALADCHFESAWSKPALVAFMMMCVARVLLRGSFPITMLTARNPGRGKSEITKMMLALAGVEPMNVAYNSDEDELTKSVASASKAGANVMVFENIDNTTINSPTLAKMSTSDVTENVRGLHTNDFIPVVSVPVIMNGNGMKPHKDLLRRTFKIMVDEPTEEGKRARPNLEDWVPDNRLKGLKHLQTLVRYGQLIADPEHTDHFLFEDATDKQGPLESYAAFKRLVGVPIMVVAGYDKEADQLDYTKAGQADVTRFHADNQEEDEGLRARDTAMKILLALFGTGKFKARDVARLFEGLLMAGYTERPFVAYCTAAKVGTDNALWRAEQLGVSDCDVTLDLLAGMAYTLEGDADSMVQNQNPYGEIKLSTAINIMKDYKPAGFTLLKRKRDNTFQFGQAKVFMEDQWQNSPNRPNLRAAT